jgi:beta-mannanase
MLNGYNEMLTLNKPIVIGEVGPKTVTGQFDYSLW